MPYCAKEIHVGRTIRRDPAPWVCHEPAAADTDAALKARHRAMWALGDYPDVAMRIIPELGSALVEVCEVRAGDRCSM